MVLCTFVEGYKIKKMHHIKTCLKIVTLHVDLSPRHSTGMLKRSNVSEASAISIDFV